MLTNNQHGFRRGKSTTTAMLALKESVKNSEDKWCVIVTIDAENAFNNAS